MPTYPRRQNGFTLLEMALVIIALGFILGPLFQILLIQEEQANLTTTDQQLADIREALIGYALIYHRLPCPADDRAGYSKSSQCDKEGFLPWANLGVQGQDSWGNVFRYRAEADFTQAIYPHRKGYLRLKTRNDRYFTTQSDDSRVIAIIFSYGRNRVPDVDNANVTSKTFIHDVYLPPDSPVQYDDRFTWISKNVIYARMVKSGFFF